MTDVSANKFVLPTEVNFSNADVLKTFEFPTIAEGWFKFRVTAAQNFVSQEDGKLSQCLTLAPLSKMDEVKWPTIRHYLRPPFGPITADTGETRKQLAFCERVIAALDPRSYAELPTKVGNAWMLSDGTIITGAQKREILLNRDVTTYGQLKMRWADPTIYVGEEMFARVQMNASKKDPSKVYSNLVEFAAKEPTDVRVEYEKFTDQGGM